MKKRPGLRVSTLLVGVALIVAACSDGGGTATIPTLPSTTTTETPATSTTTQPPTTTTTTTTEPPIDASDVLAAWDGYWSTWADVRSADTLDTAPLAALASAEVVEEARALLEAERTGRSIGFVTSIETHAAVTDDTDPTAVAIEDCIYITPSPIIGELPAGLWYQAVLAPDGDSWTIADLTLRSGHCAPAQIAADAIAGYEAYWDARLEFFDPPTPGHPLIAATLTGDQLELITGLVDRFANEGLVFRGRSETHPEVIAAEPGKVILRDCQLVDPERGVYVADTGERRDDLVDPIVDGQRNLLSADIVLEVGAWKVADTQAQPNFSCDFAPTDHGIAVIGEAAP